MTPTDDARGDQLTRPARDVVPTACATYILIAPLRDCVVAPARIDRAARPEAGVMLDRLNFDAGDLTQTVIAAVEDIDDDGLTLSGMEIRCVGDKAFGVAVATFDTAPSCDSATLERRLTEAMVGAIENVVDGGTAPWVSRTRVTTTAAFETDTTWLPTAGRVELFELTTSSDTRVEVHAGWGNCAIVTDEALSEVDLREITSGMVDAQLIWGQMADLADASATAVRRDSDSPRDAVADARRMSRQLAVDNLYYDEVLLRLQGNRVDMCVGLLTAWRYTDAHERLTRRIDELNSLAAHAMDSRVRKYQTLVEGILFVIGVSGVIQLVLAFVQTAYSGGTAAVPGETDTLSTMRWMRAINIDVLIWIPALLSVVLVIYILIVKRKDLHS